MTGADLITIIINNYTQIFSKYFYQFLAWGKWLFNSFTIISLVWLCLWLAFDKNPLETATANFIKKFFVIAFLYTIMLNAVPWLSSIVDTAQVMNQQLTHHTVDPASIIQQGLTIANRILKPIRNSGIFNMGIPVLIVTLAYITTLAAFIAVALNLTITYLLTTFLISISGLTLVFGVFSFSRNIAFRTLETIIAHSFKLLTIYLVIDAGTTIFSKITAYLPTDKIDSFDVYVWTVSIAILFWLSVKIIPQKVANLFDFSLPESFFHTDGNSGAVIVASAPTTPSPISTSINTYPAHFDQINRGS